MEGKNSSTNRAIPSCCLKASVFDPELEGKCHSTVVSGWFSELGSFSSSDRRNTFLNFPVKNLS